MTDQTFWDALKGVVSKGVVQSALIVWREMTTSGSEVQLRSLAALRTTVGVAAIYYTHAANMPLMAILSAVVVMCVPELAHRAMRAIDGFLNRVWHDLSFEQRLAATATALVFLAAGLNDVLFVSAALNLIANVIAFKVAGELALHNFDKERLNAEQRRVVAEFNAAAQRNGGGRRL